MSSIEITPEIRATANQLYMNLPWWKRAQFRKWYASNGWDVKGIYKRCLIEALHIHSMVIYPSDI